MILKQVPTDYIKKSNSKTCPASGKSWVWDHFYWHKDTNKEDKYIKVTCGRCGKQLKTNVSRMISHLKANDKNVAACIYPLESSDTESTTTTLPTSVGSEVPLPDIFNLNRVEKAQEAIMEFVIANNIALRVLSDHYFRKMLAAVRDAPPGLCPPDRRTVLESKPVKSITLKVYKHIQQKMLNPARSFGVGCAIDGWSNSRRNQISFAIIGTNGSVHLKSINIFGETKTASFLKDKIKSVLSANPETEEIDDVKSKVFYLVLDGARNGQSAIRELEKDGEFLAFWCTTHHLNLLAQDICSIGFFSSVKESVKLLIKFFSCEKQCDYLMSLAKLKLIALSPTRFVGWLVSIARILKVLPCMRALFSDDKFVNEFIGNESFQYVENIVNDKVFEFKITAMVRILFNVFLALRLSDSSSPLSGFIYPLYYHLRQRTMILLKSLCVPVDRDILGVKTAKKELLEKVNDIDEVMKIRWEEQSKGAYQLAYLLNPFYHEEVQQEWISGEFVEGMEEMKKVLNFLRCKFGCKATNDDLLTDISSYVSGTGEFLGKSFPKMSSYSQERIEDAPHMWWFNRLADTKSDLPQVACKLLGIVTDESTVERFFSRVGLNDSNLRARLSSESLNKLSELSVGLRDMEKPSKPRKVPIEFFNRFGEEMSDDEMKDLLNYNQKDSTYRHARQHLDEVFMKEFNIVLPEENNDPELEETDDEESSESNPLMSSSSSSSSSNSDNISGPRRSKRKRRSVEDDIYDYNDN